MSEISMIVETWHRKLGGKLGHFRLQLLAPGLHPRVRVKHLVEVLQLLRGTLHMVGDGHGFIDEVDNLLEIGFDKPARGQSWSPQPDPAGNKGTLILRDAVLVESDVHLKVIQVDGFQG